MKSFPILAIAAALTITVADPAAVAQRSRSGAPAAVDLKGDETPEQIQAAYTKAINDLAPNLAKADGSPLRTFEATVHFAARPGAETERAACCQAIAAALQTDAPVEAKAWMLKLVAFADRGEVVPVAARLLDDAEPLLRESARYALQHTPAPAAADALRSALAKATDPKWQGALALALGARKDTASVPALAKLLASLDEAAAESAMYALGNIANADAAKALAAARPTVPERFRAAAAESWMKCAEQMLKDGQSAEAVAIYRELNQPTQPRPVRLAALQGTLKAAGDDAADTVLSLLTGEDADARAIATGFIPDLGSGGLKKLATGMGKLSPATQVMVLGALAERGEKSALPEALAAAKSSEDSIRLAGFSALGRLGDASTVPLLVSALQTGGNNAAARESLQRLDGAGVNDAILAAMTAESDASRRAELIGVLEARSAVSAVPALLQETANDNPGVRRAALRALGRVAAIGDAPALIQSLLKSAPGAERDEAERAVTTVCARLATPDQQTAPVLEAYRVASAAEKMILLPALGRLGGTKALEAVKSALAGNDPALSKAGESALANWPDADETVEVELLTLAQRAEKPNDRTAALRAYVRVISLPSGLPGEMRLAKFQKAMDLARRDDERNLILERVTEIKHIETLRFLVPFLDQPALCSRAGNTICDLARERSLRNRHPADFTAALNRIVEVCKDQTVVDRAKRRLAEK